MSTGDTMISKSLIVGLLFTCSLFAQDPDFGNLTESSETSEVVGETQVNPNTIPDKVEGNAIRFKIKDRGVKVFPTASVNRFDPYYDASSFTNFSSATTTGKTGSGKTTVTKEKFNGGTCFGLAYFTHLWFSRLIKKTMTGATPILYKNKVASYSTMTKIGAHLSNSDAGSAHTDGVNYAVATINKNQAGFISKSKLKKDVNSYRLHPISTSKHAATIKVAAIGHHKDQLHSKVKKIRIDTTSSKDVRSKIAALQKSLKAHDTAVFFWFRFIKEGTTYKSDGGHAFTVYGVDKVTVDNKDGDAIEALKFSFVDPNSSQYHNKTVQASKKGYSTYFLYFPKSNQISFSKTVISWYGLQDGASTVDNKTTKIGWFDLYEGHSVQDDLIYDRYVDCEMGSGLALTSEQATKCKKHFEDKTTKKVVDSYNTELYPNLDLGFSSYDTTSSDHTSSESFYDVSGLEDYQEYVTPSPLLENTNTSDQTMDID